MEDFRIASGLVINPKNDNNVTICQHDIIFHFFRGCYFSLVKFSYCSKFHASVITGSGVMTIFVYKELTRHLESEITLSQFCLMSRDWNELEISYLARISSVKT